MTEDTIDEPGREFIAGWISGDHDIPMDVAREQADWFLRCLDEAGLCMVSTHDEEAVMAPDPALVGDSSELPTLSDILDRLPDGSDYDDGLEDDDGHYLGGWVAFREEYRDAKTGRAAGTLEVTTDAPALVEGAKRDTVMLRLFRVTIQEIPREVLR